MSNDKIQYINDNTHGLIELSDEERALIDEPLIQRLKFVMQLGACHQVYPGATHSRFSHSLGTMKLSGKYIKHLLKHVPDKEQIFEESDIKIARLMGLCHDVGHGPFSHTFERALNKVVRKGKTKYSSVFINHDEYRYKLFEVETFKEATQKCLEFTRENSLEECFRGGSLIRSVIFACVQGILGADRMDFTWRDARGTGTEHYGTISTEYIIKASTLKDGKLHYKEKAIWSIINAMRSREEMYKQVYQHKTCSGIEYLIEQAIYHSYNLMNLDSILSKPSEFGRLKDCYLEGLFHINAKNTEEKRSLDKAIAYYDMYTSRKNPKFISEKYVEASHPFNPNEYKSMRQTKNGSKSFVVRSKTISEINPQKFDENDIFFLSKGKSMRCREVLDQKGYVERKPYYIVRMYEMPKI